ncbi:hypothetical protein NDU88_003308 [Pleurodeles waltl]|uniref:Uncharacterized protein n=1 Tax=Pleurodeles waltl TaxID=8319 RepID=A0AAV7SG88_PLEWA|nr:hypothetical protein NDU88_003308 [Pleurodeles waltl]
MHAAGSGNKIHRVGHLCGGVWAEPCPVHAEVRREAKRHWRTSEYYTQTHVAVAMGRLRTGSGSSSQASGPGAHASTGHKLDAVLVAAERISAPGTSEVEAGRSPARYLRR